MKADILSIGAEILAGEIIDTNAAYIARKLVNLGIELQRVTQVGDNLADIVDALSQARSRSDVIICTGGIGPTPDDLTREAVAQLLGEELSVDPNLESKLRDFFRSRGSNMPSMNIKQATLIPSARPLDNKWGTAPGWWVEKDNKIIVLLPGVPREMYALWEHEVEPRLRDISRQHIVTKTIKTFGLGESTVADMLGTLFSSSNPLLGTYARADGVHVVVRSIGDTREEAEKLAEEVVSKIRIILERYIWAEGDVDLPQLVCKLLSDAKKTLSTHEWASMGLLSKSILTQGASSIFAGGVVGGEQQIPADLLLETSKAVEQSGSLKCLVRLVDLINNDELAKNEVYASSIDALAERSTVSALHLVRSYLSCRG